MGCCCSGLAMLLPLGDYAFVMVAANRVESRGLELLRRGRCVD